MNLDLDLTAIPAHWRRWIYAAAAIVLLVLSAWQAADGNWPMFAIKLLLAVAPIIAAGNVPPSDAAIVQPGDLVTIIPDPEPKQCVHATGHDGDCQYIEYVPAGDIIRCQTIITECEHYGQHGEEIYTAPDRVADVDYCCVTGQLDHPDPDELSFAADTHPIADLDVLLEQDLDAASRLYFTEVGAVA